jgi:acid phosphatase class B
LGRARKTKQHPVLTERAHEIVRPDRIIEHEDHRWDASICLQRGHNARQLVASHGDQGDIVLVFGSKSLGDVDTGSRSTPANHVFERQAVAADISEALTPREQSDKLTAFLKSGRVQRSDYACSVDENFHGTLRADSRRIKVKPSVRLPPSTAFARANDRKVGFEALRSIAKGGRCSSRPAWASQ